MGSSKNKNKKEDFTLGETLNPKTLMNIPQMEVVGPHENYNSVP
jgi:hypothetical protein